MLGLVILIVSCLISSLLALVVLIKDPRSATNRAFAALAILLALQPIPNYLSLNLDNHLFYIRVTMLAVVVLSLSFRWLTAWFPKEVVEFGWLRGVELLGAAVAGIAIVSPIGFTSVVVSASGNISPQPGPGMAIFVAFFVYAVGWGILDLARRIREFRGIARTQLQYLLVASILLFGLEVISGLILPFAFNFSGAIQLTPVYFVIFNLLIAVAIVRQRLFDIRMIVARSIAYVLLLSSLVAIYTLLIVGLSMSLLRKSDVNLGYHLINLLIAILLAFTLPPLKRFFDHTTNNFFFREAYDPQAFLGELNKTLVSDLDLQVLLSHASKVIATNFSAKWCSFYIRDETSHTNKLVGYSNRYFSHADTDFIYRATSESKQRVIEADGLRQTSPDLYRVLSGNDIVLMAVLTPPSASPIGHIYLGPKKSGNPYSAADERIIDIISRSLLIAIQNSLRFEEIQNFNSTLKDKVDSATRELRSANDKLREMDDAKDDFITMASHQLRTPLTSVKGYISMILDGDAGRVQQDQRTMLEQAYTSAQRMVYLIADLLNVSRLNTGKFVIEDKPVDLAALVQNEIAQLSGAITAKQLTLTANLESNLPELMLDETKVRQVIMNFVDNAIYYTPENGTIAVNLARSKDDSNAVDFTVTDSGIGVPASERHRLFTKFYRAKNAQKVRPDGTGIGLFMARKVIAAEHGSIIFNSQENQGSTFGFRVGPRRGNSQLEGGHEVAATTTSKA